MRRQVVGNTRGSALITVIFILALLTGIGITLLFLATNDVRMNQAGLRAKRTFFVAEAGLEDARGALRVANLASANPDSLDDELAAAASDTDFDFDVAQLRPVYDAAGNVTSFTGYTGDVPLRPFTTFGNGAYAAFLQNDPADGVGNLTDTNDRVLVTAIGTGSSRSVEVVQAVLERVALPPFAAAITLLGALPNFDGGNSNAKEYSGTDCDGVSGHSGVPGLWVPTVGTIGTAARDNARTGVRKPGSYSAGPHGGTDTVLDVTGTIDPLWNDCAYLASLAGFVRERADYVCTPSAPCSHWSTSGLSTITFSDGDLTLGPGDTGQGLLFVTGHLTIDGHTSWSGILLVIGKGEFERSGGGNGTTSGATLVANVAGPDRILGTADDCSTGVGGIANASYTVDGSGNHDLAYCSDVVNDTNYGFPFRIVDFRQR